MEIKWELVCKDFNELKYIFKKIFKIILGYFSLTDYFSLSYKYEL